MTERERNPGVTAMTTVDCPWCAAPASIAEVAGTEMLVCGECAVSAQIAPDSTDELDLAA